MNKLNVKKFMSSIKKTQQLKLVIALENKIRYLQLVV